MWCSGWEEKANEHLPFALGLPADLPHLTFDGTEATGRHWKLGAIEAYAGPRRPLAWIDDAFDASCRRWAAGRAGPTELVLTDPGVGLTADHAARLRAWSRALGVSGSGSVEGAVPAGAGPEPLQP